MKILDVISFLESLAPPLLQEQYDNSGLIAGDKQQDCSGIICCLDATEEVVQEAMARKCNLVVAHHPIIFSALKKITGRNYVEKALITAIRNDVAIYAIHTNLDNTVTGVNGKIAAMLGLQNVSVLVPKERMLRKLYTFAPVDKAEQVRNAIFGAGAGQIGNYSECSFNAEGTGTFKAGEGSDPYVGQVGQLHREKEVKIEAIFPAWLEANVVRAMKNAHPYEEVAYDIVDLANTHSAVGSGIIGELKDEMTETAFLCRLKDIFKLTVIRHTILANRPVKKVAVCGGAGSFLIPAALSAGADVFITSDVKYHEFFDANGSMVIADIGHFESEQFTVDLLCDVLVQKFRNFAVLKTGVNTNPVRYFTGL